MLGAAASTPVTEDHDEKWGVPSLSELGEIKVQYFFVGKHRAKSIFFYFAHAPQGSTRAAFAPRFG